MRQETRRLYGRLLWRHYTSVYTRASVWIAQGMSEVSTGDSLGSPTALRLLCCGDGAQGADAVKREVERLRSHSHYRGGLHARSKRVRMLWKVRSLI